MKSKPENKEIQALIDLLDEPDEKLFLTVKTRLLEWSVAAIPILETAWENTFNPTIQVRIEDIIHQIQFNDLIVQLKNWKESGKDDLLLGSLLVCRYQYPEIHIEDLVSQVEQLKWDIWLELNENLTALEKVNVVNHVFYEIHRFGANKHQMNALQNFFLNNLLETKRGNLITLGILYLVLCQKLGLPVHGVIMADQLMLAYTSEVVQDGVVLFQNRHHVLFYINPLKKGGIFSRQQAEAYLQQVQVEPQARYFEPQSTIGIIRHLISSLSHAYESFRLPDKVMELNDLLQSLQ